MIKLLSILFLIIVAFSLPSKKKSKENKKNIEVKISNENSNGKNYSGEIAENQNTELNETQKKLLTLYD